MANEEEVEYEGSISPEISDEMLIAEGLKRVKSFGGRAYGLVDVALKENRAKCEALHRLLGDFRAQGIPAREEEKARVICLYASIE